MLRTIIIACISVALCLVCVTGCGKKETPKSPPTGQTTTQAPTQAPAEAPAAEEQPKTAEQYKAEADKQITQENAAQELDKLEKSVNEEAAQQP